MTDAIEQALESISGGILFCIAVSLVLFLHHSYNAGMKELPATSANLILYEEDTGWKLLEE